MRLPVIPVKGDEKWELLSKIMDKLESREAKKALVRNKTTPVNKALLKIVVIKTPIFGRNVFSLEQVELL